MAPAYPRARVARPLGSAPCSPTTTCTCAPTRTTRPPERYFTGENVDRYLAAAEAAGIEELGVSEHVYRFTPGARPLAPPVLGGAGARRPRRLLRVRRARRRCGSGSSATSSPAPRTAPRRCSRRATSTTSSARSTSSATRAVDHEGWDVWERERRPRRGLAPLLRGARRVRPLAASSTSSPTPTWSRSGAAPGRCPSATRASTTSRRSRRSPRAGSRSRSRPPGCASRSARSTRRRPSPRCASRPGAVFALSSDAHLPEQVGFGYEQALEFLDELGVEEICVFEGRRRRLEPLGPASARGSSSMSVGIGYDSHRFAEGRRLVLGGVEIEHARGLAGHSDADVLTHAVIDALLGAAGHGRHRHPLPRRRRALARRRLDRPAAHRRSARSPAAIVNIDATVDLRGAAARPPPGRDGADRSPRRPRPGSASRRRPTRAWAGSAAARESPASRSLRSRANSLRRCDGQCSSSIAASARQSVSDTAFEVEGAARGRGRSACIRPDKPAKVGTAFLRWGASPATGDRDRGDQLPARDGADRRTRLAHLRAAPPALQRARPRLRRRWGSATATASGSCAATTAASSRRRSPPPSSAPARST